MAFGWSLDRNSDSSEAGKHPCGYRKASYFQTSLSRAELTHMRTRLVNRLVDLAMAD